MNRLVLFIIACLMSCFSIAQSNPDAKRDFNWAFGPLIYPPDYGTSVLDFNSTPPSSSFHQACLSLSWTNSSISDTNGKLLFYSNGMYVADSTHHRMPHGDSLNYGTFYNDVNDSTSGYNLPQGLLILPRPNHLTQYYIIHERLILDANYYAGIRIDGLYYTKVDMTLNNGLGDVTENQKNIPIFQDTLGFGMVSAVRHGNGRDWWIIVEKENTNCFFRILLTPDGFTNYGLQCVGGLHKMGSGQVVFSPNGSQYFRCVDTLIESTSYIDVYSFDRCSGSLSEFRRFSTPNWSFNRGIAISPNSRFLYFSDQIHLYQYDLESSDIGSTQQLIAIIDTSFHDPYGLVVDYGQQLLGPDGRIYIVSNSTKFFSVINQPDSAGIACDFQAHSFQISTITEMAMPDIPNFRLGRLPGSACDTLIVSISDPPTKDNTIKVFPNPASDFVTISFDIVNNNIPMKLEIYNSLSQRIREIPLSPFQGLVRLDVENFTPGVYMAVLKKGDYWVSINKFSVSH